MLLYCSPLFNIACPLLMDIRLQITAHPSLDQSGDGKEVKAEQEQGFGGSLLHHTRKCPAVDSFKCFE
jgi:hypothetical protein